MKRQAYQHPELRDANDSIIQEGTYGKASPLVNSTNDGVLDYINNNLEALHDAQTAAGNAITTGTLTVSDKTTTGTLEAISATVSGQTTTGTLAAGDTTVTGSITTTGLTVTGTTSVPTANAGNSSKAIANTEYVQGELTNYLPLSGGTLTGVVNGVTPPAGDNSTKIATTEFVNAKAGNYLPLTGGTVTGVVNGVTPPSGDNSTKIATTAFVNANTDVRVSAAVPTGVVQAFAGNTLPNGWLLCDGSAVSRTDYAALFSAIGTTYGGGNGSTTFNLPNLTDRFIQGNSTVGTVKSAGLPNITGSATNLRETTGSSTVTNGALYFHDDTLWPNQTIEAKKNYKSNLWFDASLSSSIYGKSTTVQPPALTMRYIIKY